MSSLERTLTNRVPFNNRRQRSYADVTPDIRDADPGEAVTCQVLYYLTEDIIECNNIRTYALTLMGNCFY